MKKYMAYSFGTLWTLVLIIALVGALIHQIKFQSSPAQLKLNYYIGELQMQNRQLDQTAHSLTINLDSKNQMILELLSAPYYE